LYPQTVKNTTKPNNNPCGTFQVAPGVLEHHMTMLRDPAHYIMAKRMDYIFGIYKKHLPAYTHDDLIFPGVKIESLEVDKLITYFDTFDMALDNAMSIGAVEDGVKVNIQVRQMRLNHKPFTFKVKVASDKAATVMVRVFLGPKFDSLGNEYTLDQLHLHMIELDRFTHKSELENTHGKTLPR
jgi:Hemocyanin, ig-like domain